MNDKFHKSNFLLKGYNGLDAAQISEAKRPTLRLDFLYTLYLVIDRFLKFKYSNIKKLST